MMTYRTRHSVAVAALILLSNLAGCANSKKAEMRRRMGEIPEKYKNDGAPQVGDTAYLFKLKTIDGDEEVDIGRAIGVRPVALIFGSYT